MVNVTAVNNLTSFSTVEVKYSLTDQLFRWTVRLPEIKLEFETKMLRKIINRPIKSFSVHVIVCASCEKKPKTVRFYKNVFKLK